ncbi:MAG TPA: dienelactone hydrolase family protein, partial [Solirubrobacterales bacterium]|nr:dienelactone hydrolase family protein [Solirubrobacterales bacterium]
MGEVEFEANGGTGRGYLAEPDVEGPGVIVIHEWWGLDDSMRKMADRFAEEGFVALAPDLFEGDTTEQPDEAQQKLMALNMDKAVKQMRGAVKHLLEHPKCNGQIGSVGFCAGGGLAVWAAAETPEIGAAVTYYYVMPHGKPDFSKIEGPVLGHFGTSDDFVSVDAAKALEAELQEAGVDAAFEFYEGAGHAFANDHDRL